DHRAEVTSPFGLHAKRAPARRTGMTSSMPRTLLLGFLALGFAVSTGACTMTTSPSQGSSDPNDPCALSMPVQGPIGSSISANGCGNAGPSTLTFDQIDLA